MFGERKDCTPIADALHNCMFWLQRKDIEELVRRIYFSCRNEVKFGFFYLNRKN
jgi:hypothetical protein